MTLITALLVFLVSAAVTWFAGVVLAKSTSTIDSRFKLGDAFGGMILLGIVGSLTELAVTYAAAQAGNMAVIIGNITGGVAMKTFLIPIFDVTVRGKRPLSYLAGSAMLSFEVSCAIGLALLAVAGSFISPQSNLFYMNPMSLALVAGLLFSIWVINRVRKNPLLASVPADANPGRLHHERRAVENHPFFAGKSNMHVIVVFLLAAVAVLLAGFGLEQSGTMIADAVGMSSGFFAATVIAFMSVLPELSTGVESIMIADHQLAISDIIGGNIFILLLFPIADLITGQPILSYLEPDDTFLLLLGAVMMGVYAFTFRSSRFRPSTRRARLGWDSILVLILYLAGLIWLFWF